MVEKIKNLFVVTQTYFDFADGNIYGVSGKIVRNFSVEAKRILKSEQNDDFLAMYFYERTLTCPYRDTLKKWPTSLVETIYSLYGNRYSVDVLSGVAEFCYRKNSKLDKKGVKILTKALSSLEDNGNRRFRYLNSFQLENKILEVSYSYLPAAVIPFITHANTNKMRNYVVEDAQKKLLFGMSMKTGIIWIRYTMVMNTFITMCIITFSFAIFSTMSGHTKICISRFV